MRKTAPTNSIGRTVVAAAVVLALCMPGSVASAQTRPSRPHPNSQAYLHYSLGRLLEVSGSLSEALVQYRRADAIDPGHCELGTAVARTLYALGKAEQALTKSAQAMALCPGDLEATATHAEILLVNDEAEKAERLLRDVARGPSAPREFAVLYGQSLLSQGKLEEGEQYLRSRAVSDSLDPDVASMLGRTLLLLGESEEAVVYLRRSARLNPGDRAVSGMLARLLITLDRPEEGVPLLEWVHSRFRAVEPEFISLAAGHSMLGDHERAHAVLDSAVARFGETRAILRARGATYFSQGDTNGAVESYEKLLEANPESVTALNFIAYTLADEDRDLDHALDYAQRAVSLESDNPFLRDTLGWTHFRLGNIEEARRELVLAIELGGENPVVLEHLGDVLLASGDADAAVEAWMRALERQPGRGTALERLDGVDAKVPERLRSQPEGDDE